MVSGGCVVEMESDEVDGPELDWHDRFFGADEVSVDSRVLGVIVQ